MRCLMRAKKNYRDSLFRSLFNNKRKLLELINALEGTRFTDPKEIRITTLKGTFFNDLKNDISFQIGDRYVVLLEHQSTHNENMPLRCFFYLAKLMQKAVDPKSLYKEKRISLPAPHFYVFYNGEQNAPEEQKMRLSDAFAARDAHMELTVKLYNINYDVNKELLKKSQTMRDYSFLTARIQRNLHTGIPLQESINEAIRYCLKHDIMKEFLAEKSREVYDMLSFKWDENIAKEVWKEEAREEGLEQGLEQGLKQGIEQGIKQGIKQGIEQGIEQGQLKKAEATALDMLRDKMDLRLIMKYTKLSLDKIDKLGRMHGLL